MMAIKTTKFNSLIIILITPLRKYDVINTVLE